MRPLAASVLPVDTVLRDDVSRPSTPRDALLGNAADTADGTFRVEAVWDEAP